MFNLHLFGLISLAVCGLCYGQEIGECSSPDLTNDDFLFGVINDANINVNHSGVIKEYDMINTVSVISSHNNPLSGTYINARYDEATRRLQIFATEQLAVYEQRESATSIQLTMMLGCTGGSRRLIFEQPLNEENNHDPVFSKEIYEFEVMLPLPRGFDLTFFQEVSARDLDIRNNQVHFSSPDSEVISVGTARRVGDDGKTFYASMITVHQLLSVGEQLEFTIVATDSGTPPRSTQSRVIVRSDAEDVFIPVPKFENAFYRGQIDEERRLIIDQLRLTEDTYHKEIALGFSGGDSSLFALSIDDVTTLITISFQRPLTDQNIANKSILLTTLVANRADVDRGSTVIIVDIPLPKLEDPELPVPQFEHNVYVGQLDEQRLLSLPEVTIVEATFVPEVVVSLSGMDSGLFRIANTRNSYRVTLAQDLLELDVQFRTYLAANLTATRSDVDGIGTATLLVNIAASENIPIPRFEKSIYVGEVDAATKNLVLPIQPILNTSTYSSDILFSLNGGDADLFRIEENRNTPSLMLIDPLTEQQMQRTLLTTTVWARRANDENSGSTEIIVTTPTEADVLTFTEPNYMGQINVDRTLSLPLVTLNLDTYTDDVTFTLIGDETNLLQLTSNRNIVTFTLNREITDNDLSSRTYYKFNLQANNNRLQTATTLLLIDIITPEVADSLPLPTFEKLIYIGELDNNRKLVLEKLMLSIDTYSSEITFSLTEGNSSLFEVNQIENVITISLVRELTESDIRGTNFLSTVLKASRPNVGECTTTILIRLSAYDQTIKPIFEQTFYLANLNATDGTLSYELSPTVESSTYDPEVKFSLSGVDADLFILENELNTLNIQLSRQLTEEEKRKPVLLATITATALTGQRSTTEWFVIQEQSMLLDQPIFEQRLYTGTIDEYGKSIDLPLIRLTSPSEIDGLKFELLDADSSALVMTATDSGVSIDLSRDLNIEELAKFIYIKALVVVTNSAQNISSTAFLIIDITQPAVRPAPQFVQGVYRGWVDAERILTFEDVRVLPETFTNDVLLSLRDDDHALFTATKTQNDVISIALAAPLTDSDLDNRTYLTTVINANRPDVGQSSALLLVHLHLTTPRPTIPQPQFSQPLFRGRIDNELQLEAMEDITLVASTFVPGTTTFQLIGEDNLLFEATADAHQLKINLRPGLSEAHLADKDYLSFRVDASHPETSHSSAAVLIDLPPKVCPIDETPIFENSVYQLSFATTETGRIGQIRARVPGSVDRELQYRLISIPDDLKDRFHVDSKSGDLNLSSSLSVGDYSVQVAAIDSSTGLQGNARVRLIVTAELSCPPNHLGPHVNNSLQIVYLIENQEHLDIMPSLIEDCTFEVVKTIPNDMDYVSIDSTTKMIRSIKLDREADIFASMVVPQIQVSLQLVCANDDEMGDIIAPVNQYSTSNFELPVMQLDPISSDGRWYTLTNSMNYSRRSTQLTIIIEDENDNFPTFITPIVNELLYGYPDAPLAELIMPVHLLQVRAIDRDAGLNAKILFSMESNRHFQINGETGVVTPVRDAFTTTGETEEVSLVVRATDRNGSADGLTTERTLRVHRLRVQQIIVISVQEQDVAEDVDRVVDQVYANVGLELMVLHAARITVSAGPNRSSGARQGSTSAENVLRMFAYVVRDNVAIMEATDVQKTLINFDANIYNLSTMTLSQHQQITMVETVQNREQLALVIVCVVLGVLLLMTCIATFLMWWYKIRPYEYRKMQDDESVGHDETPVSSSAQVGMRGSSDVGLNGPDALKSQNDKAVFMLDGTTTQETTDDTLNAQLSRYLSGRVDKINGSTTVIPPPPPPPPPPRHLTQLPSTGVRFNELVERIDIVVEPETEHFDSDREENRRA